MQRDTLTAQGLVCYRGDQCLFNGLDFELCSEQLLIIEGHNGSGKTSLLKLIAGLRYPDAGELYWNGQALNQLANTYRQHLTYVGHQDGVKRELTVRENIKLLQELLAQQGHTVDDMVEQLNLKIQQDSLAVTLSAGQRRRIALARAIFSQARLWILDEPFTALDKATSKYLLRAIQGHLQHGGMVVMTSHHDVVLSDVSIQRLVLQ